MRLSFPLFLLLGSCAFAQTATPQMPEIITITPETVVAIVNGQKFTAGQFEQLTKLVNTQMRTLAGTKPQQFFEDYAHSLVLVAEAEKAKLQDRSPYRDRLAEARRQILTQAAITEHSENIKISDDAIQAHFTAHKDDYKQARVKVIFVSRISQLANASGGPVKSTPPEEIKAKVDEIARKLKEGAGFAAIAKEYSDDRGTAEKDADLPGAIRSKSQNVPQNMRDAILAAEAGAIVGPLEHATGYYFFRVESVENPNLTAVRADIEKDLKAAATQRWLDEIKAKASVTLENQPFWQTFLAANQEAAAPAPAEEPNAKSTAGTGGK